METEQDNLSHKKIIVASTTLVSWISAGTFIFHRLEEWTWIQSFYFSVVTITTVGYGDLTPSTETSRLFTAVYILIGVSIGIVTLGMIGAVIINNREKNYDRKRKKRQE